MAVCSYCDTTILFGGTRQGDLRFCNDDCQNRGALAYYADQLPREEVEKYIQSVHGGDCPNCNGAGPVDIHTSYRVWSAFVLTSWASRPLVCCRRCGVRRKLEDMLFSSVLGWWGMPWGLLVTPLQLGRNFFGLFSAPDPAEPSRALEKILKLQLAAQVLESQQIFEPDA